MAGSSTDIGIVILLATQAHTEGVGPKPGGVNAALQQLNTQRHAADHCGTGAPHDPVRPGIDYYWKCCQDQTAIDLLSGLHRPTCEHNHRTT